MTTQPKTANITADDVAIAAGVSRWTVNRAFKKDASISPKTRDKVMKIAEEMGYIPDLRAASLASDRSNLVALLVDDFSNPHKLVMLERLTTAMRSRGWDTLLVNTLDANDTAPALMHASRRRVDASILIGLQFDDDVLETVQKAHNIKKLIIFARRSEQENTISICVDDRQATLEIANYVADKGYKKPFYVAGPRTTSAHLSRKETFAEYWSNTFGTDVQSLAVGAYDSILATNAVQTRFANVPSDGLPDILVCENDAIAMGAIDAVRHHLGLRVPEDIAVFGFDDVPQGASPNYRLSTYRQPMTDMANYLVDVLESNDTTNMDRQFIGTLIIRESA
ncbi:LacI family transcriptional regulator [Marivivens niveibacter]|uniref:LacI family transcriptional regulator n=1 Tax=Marivivens niveibacter TaxID=1930667 RepID=A0A251WUQ5_9RHOB|nr:substrate-binding domain-containing protein [Marivivens niveibacter]OUD08086.1 LacI family transcriptional regulator [Marivivens niveibacter]